MTVLVFGLYAAVLVAVMAIFDAILFQQPYLTSLQHLVFCRENRMTVYFTLAVGGLWSAVSMYSSKKRAGQV
ncbi:hypothetical protein [Ectobacillus ponti]|uniref:Uncharacterized protein n=1 Tax=Ectobacillus ponti TaxID=2961894 RepID=A0AA41X8G1_9BACI|nr:hypothetical protein [Ectobacillus ponti]MCP8970821.1 hypothetical protein [Ectobacillus ponti]